MTIDLEVTNGGVVSDIVTINKPGYGYAAADVVFVTSIVLQALDPSTGGSNELEFGVSSATNAANAGDLFALLSPLLRSASRPATKLCSTECQAVWVHSQD